MERKIGIGTNVGLQFCDLDDKIREKIIKFVFDVERKNKKS